MNSIDKNKPVVVTGAAGYIASWIVRYLLEEGIRVNATIRSPENSFKTSHLRKWQGQFPGKLNLFCADLLKEDSFRAAMRGASVVIHTASPFLVTGIKDSYHQLINPAVQGVKNVINSVNITPSVHRLILTSSIAAVYGDHSEIKNTNSALFDESCWNKTSTPRHRPYSYSKTIAEKQAWSMVREQNRWDLVVLNPGRVFGPSLSSRTDNVSVKTMLQFGNGCFKRGLPQIFTPLVDVRDVAKAHINAAFNSAANGRYILVSQVLPLLKIAAMLRENFSNQYPFPRQRLYKLIFWLGAPLLGYSRRYVSNNVNIPIRVDNSRSKQDLALDYIKVERTITDHFQQLINDNLLKVVN